MKRLRRYGETLRYLKPIQIFGRLAFHLFRPRLDLSSPPSLRFRLAALVEGVARPPSMLGPERFRFLNQNQDVTEAQDWTTPTWPKLWRYNLHYFDDLNARDALDRRSWHTRLIARWRAENPPGTGDGWEPYPLSLRIVNWIKAEVRGGGLLEDHARHSLAVQVRYLARRLEWHILGNHLLANAKALVFAGLYFGGCEGDAWRRLGLKLYERQLPEQILADGAHFERSPMYHALILEDLLDCMAMLGVYGHPVPPEWPEWVTRMFAWLYGLTHPDGRIAFFNDAAFGIAAEPAQLLAYAGRLGLVGLPGSDIMGSRLFAASGYGRLVAGNAVAVVDVAPIGPDYLPGHAHADTLSFELSLGERRLLVNSGTSLYQIGPDRQRERGTAAHNTLRLDDADSSEVWAGFRVARRARVAGVTFEAASGRLAASHDGYRHRPGQPHHRRSWRIGLGELEIEDHLLGGGHHKVEVFFHLHPDFRFRREDGGSFVAETRAGVVVLTVEGAAELEWQVIDGVWCPEFGLAIANHRLCGVARKAALPLVLRHVLRWKED